MATFWRKSSQSKTTMWWCKVVIAIVVLLAIFIPVGILLHGKGKHLTGIV